VTQAEYKGLYIGTMEQWPPHGESRAAFERFSGLQALWRLKIGSDAVVQRGQEVQVSITENVEPGEPRRKGSPEYVLWHAGRGRLLSGSRNRRSSASAASAASHLVGP
jgi:hypothetical protein